MTHIYRRKMCSSSKLCIYYYVYRYVVSRLSLCFSVSIAVCVWSVLIVSVISVDPLLSLCVSLASGGQRDRGSFFDPKFCFCNSLSVSSLVSIRCPLSNPVPLNCILRLFGGTKSKPLASSHLSSGSNHHVTL